ncbi:MAG: thioredoxin domain-containing protein [Candidatus Pacearchaeota archaeon]
MEEVKDVKLASKGESKTENYNNLNFSNSNNSQKKYNGWMILSIILGVIIVILLVVLVRGGITGKTVIKGDDAGKKLVDFLNEKTGGGVEYINYSEEGKNLYQITVNYQGQKFPLYITKDGEYFVQGAIPLSENSKNTPECSDDSDCSNGEICKNGVCVASPKPVPKTAKPVVEAFVFSYCPYGIQFEKALFPVYDLLKNKVDINIVAIGAMHGEYERIESLRQISIEKLYGKDKLFAYLKEFSASTDIGSCRGDAACLDKFITDIFKKLGIDKTKVENYMKNDAPKIYDEQNSRANSLGISGSPTFVINGVEVQVNRTPEAIKQAICDAFTTKPSECSKNLSSSPVSAGFGTSSSNTNSAGSC